MDQNHEDHGLSAEVMPEIMEQLGITEHSAEDCALTMIIAEATGLLTLVEGPAVFLYDEQEADWVRYRITAAERRRTLSAIQQEDIQIDLQPWQA